MSFHQLQEKCNLSDSCLQQYNNLIPVLKSCLQKFDSIPMAESFTPNSPLFHVPNDSLPSASFIYKILSTPIHTWNKSNAEIQWEQDLSLSLSISQWDRVWQKLFKTSKAASLTQSLYLVFSRVVMTPCLLHKFNSSISTLCWSCANDVGSLIHLLYYCPKVFDFWKAIWSKCLDIFSLDVPFNIHNIFLGTLSPDFDQVASKSILLDLFIAVAFKVILMCWKDNSKLSFVLWWNLICDEHRIASVSNRSLHSKIKSDLLWMPFSTYLSSSPSSS